MIDYNFVPHSIQEIASELFAETLFSESPWESIVTTEEATITKRDYRVLRIDEESWRLDLVGEMEFMGVTATYCFHTHVIKLDEDFNAIIKEEL